MSINSSASGYTNSYSPHTSNQYVLENKIQGKWRSESDEKSVLIFRDLNRYFEYYNGSMINSGAWFLRQSLVDTKFADVISSKGSETYLYKRLIDSNTGQSPEKKVGNTSSGSTEDNLYDNDLIYKISLSSDYNELTLIDLETGESLNFKREHYDPSAVGGLKKVI